MVKMGICLFILAAYATMVVRGFHWHHSPPLLYSEQLMQLYCARQRRRLNRGLRRKQQSLLKRLRKAKKEAPPMEKPEVVKTHLRDMVILPEMVGSMVGVYNGKTFNQVEIKVRHPLVRCEHQHMCIFLTPRLLWTATGSQFGFILQSMCQIDIRFN